MIRKLTMTRTLAALALTGTLAGCSFDENLPIHNMRGTIVVPREAATRTLADADGNDFEITDVRNIGPIYIGLYPSVFPADVVDSYPHPEIGPQFLEGVQGDTYPYGGTTVGDLRFGCFESLVCKLASGRFVDYDSIVDWFNNTLNDPIVDPDDRLVESGVYFQQTCWDLMEVTSDEEVRITAFEDQNDDGKLTELDLDLVENADGDFEGEFLLQQQDFYWDQNQQDCEPGIDCTGFSVWAFMDGPAQLDSTFTTCESAGQLGFEVEDYQHDFFGGRVESNVLNQPGSYISLGDWVSDSYVEGGQVVDGAYVWNNMFDRPVIRLGHEVE